MSFDGTPLKAPSAFQAMRELNAIFLAPRDAILAQAFQKKGIGDGHPVLVIPGLGADDTTMAAFRRMLQRAGYDPSGWGLGRNKGYSLDDEQRLVELVHHLHQTTGQRVSVIGWSLGGAYARAIGQAVPGSVRQVITMGTPFKGLDDTTPGQMYEQKTGKPIRGAFEPGVWDRLATLANTIPVPYTSIYSREDGIAHWQSCHAELDEITCCQSVEVDGQHFGLPYRLEVFKVVEALLEGDLDDWRPHPNAVAANLGR